MDSEELLKLYDLRRLPFSEEVKRGVLRYVEDEHLELFNYVHKRKLNDVEKFIQRSILACQEGSFFILVDGSPISGKESILNYIKVYFQDSCQTRIPPLILNFDDNPHPDTAVKFAFSKLRDHLAKKLSNNSFKELDKLYDKYIFNPNALYDKINCQMVFSKSKSDLDAETMPIFILEHVDCCSQIEEVTQIFEGIPLFVIATNNKNLLQDKYWNKVKSEKLLFLELEPLMPDDVKNLIDKYWQLSCNSGSNSPPFRDVEVDLTFSSFEGSYKWYVDEVIELLSQVFQSHLNVLEKKRFSHSKKLEDIEIEDLHKIKRIEPYRMLYMAYQRLQRHLSKANPELKGYKAGYCESYDSQRNYGDGSYGKSSDQELKEDKARCRISYDSQRNHGDGSYGRRSDIEPPGFLVDIKQEKDKREKRLVEERLQGSRY